MPPPEVEPVPVPSRTTACPYCADMWDKDGFVRHCNSKHKVAFLANLPRGDTRFREATSDLPYCDVCKLYICHGQMEQHEKNSLHKTNAAFVSAEEIIWDRGSSGDAFYWNDYHHGADGNDQEHHGSHYWEPYEGFGYGGGLFDWLHRDRLDFASHPWIGEVLLTAAADMSGDGTINAERNLNWTLYRRLRIVNVTVDDEGMEV